MARKPSTPRTKTMAEEELPKVVRKFFFGSDSIKSKEELRARNIDFMKRCAANELKEDEQIRGGAWAQKLPKEKLNELLAMIFSYDDWSEKTDPQGTRGNGVVIFEGNYVMWAIREVNLTPPMTVTSNIQRAVCLLVRHSSEI